MQVRKKLRRVKRLAYLGAIVGIVVAVRRTRAARGGPELGAPATWPPLEPVTEAPVAALGDLVAPPHTTHASPAAAEPDHLVHDPQDPPTSWVPPLPGGTCPTSHPIKANKNSKIFHEPGGRFYERTQAERCYVDAVAAAADGYRAAKGANGGSDGSISQEDR